MSTDKRNILVLLSFPSILVAFHTLFHFFSPLLCAIEYFLSSITVVFSLTHSLSISLFRFHFFSISFQSDLFVVFFFSSLCHKLYQCIHLHFDPLIIKEGKKWKWKIKWNRINRTVMLQLFVVFTLLFYNNDLPAPCAQLNSTIT